MSDGRRGRWAPVAALALSVYIPLLLTAPGRVGADTKSYLYLDPDRMLSRAWSMWDANIGLGTVTHQNIGYLWPMGPWFWAAEHAGLPDWVAQRLWLGTILFAAGVGVIWLLRSVLGWTTMAATAAAFVYACTPYVLTLAARISIILLPFAGLPWLIGLAARSVRRGGWRDPALFALVVATVGSVNATGLLLVGLGPLLWLVHVRLSREATTRAVLAATARIGALTVACSLWWIAGLWAQGGYGVEILRYTETAEVVASASNAAEVLRSLGYWFFYGGDRLGPWIEPSVSYTQRLPLLALTYALPVAALAGLGAVRFRHRSFFVSLVVVGALIAVGAHPWDDPTLLGAGMKEFLLSDVGLAMRSLPRAVPLVALGLAAGLGAGIEALATATAEHRRRIALPAAVVVAVAAYAALPPLWTGGMVAENLDRPEDIPAYWDEVAAYLDGRDDGTRVLELPGSDFASYRWGNTVDPITPGLINRPYAARELIPYGSPPSADLLNALDRRVQERVLDPGALAVVARLMGVGDIVVRDDLQFERYRTPRPYVLAPALHEEPDLGRPAAFGPETVNTPVAEAPLLDELALLADDGEPRPPVEVLPVEDAVAMVRTAPAVGGIVLAGDGEGLVDAASAGLLRGDELVRYAASLGQDGVAEALDDGAALIVTDGNRRQGVRWSTVRDTLGFVEPIPTLGEDLTDNRLPVFTDESGWETTAATDPVTATATSYGNPISFTPEYRPANAVDGDLGTEWRTGASADVRGERLEIHAPGTTTGELVLVQQLTGQSNRHITEVELRFDDGGPAQRVALDDSSRTPEGQQVVLEGGPRTFDTLTVEIVAESSGRIPKPGRPVRFNGLSQVGFAEVDLGTGAALDPDLVVPPAATAAIDDDTPVAIVLSRWRTEATEAVRRDPEPALSRRLTLPVPRSFELEGDARLSADAPDAVLDAITGVTGPSVTGSSRLAGAVVERGSAALDGDPTTWWSPAFGDDEPSLTIDAGTEVQFDHLDLAPVDDGRRSLPSRLRIEADGAVAATVDVTPGEQRVDLPETVSGRSIRVVIEAVEPRTTTEWFSSSTVVVPPAIAELGLPGLQTVVPRGPVDTGCRDDLVSVDGEAVAVRARGTVDPLDRVPLTLSACDGAVDLPRGDREVVAGSGETTGIDIDRLVLRGGGPASGPLAAPGDAPVVSVTGEGRASMDLHVDGAVAGEPFWLVLGQSFNEGWSLGGAAPELVDGYANGWLVTPDADGFDLRLEWRPQRVVNVALGLSAVAAVACLALVVIGDRRRRAAIAPESSDDDAAAAPTRRTWPTWAVALAIATGTFVAAGPVVAVVVLAATALADRSEGAARLLRWAPAAALGVGALYVVGRQAISHPTAAFEWPAEQSAAHGPALAALALLVAAVVVDERRYRRTL